MNRLIAELESLIDYREKRMAELLKSKDTFSESFFLSTFAYEERSLNGIKSVLSIIKERYCEDA